MAPERLPLNFNFKSSVGKSRYLYYVRNTLDLYEQNDALWMHK